MTQHLVVDPTKCDGVGICAIKAPDLITLDDWGFPMIKPSDLIDSQLLKQAKRAVGACPKRALLIVTRNAEEAERQN